jgi:hypothetical protein
LFFGDNIKAICSALGAGEIIENLITFDPIDQWKPFPLGLIRHLP